MIVHACFLLRILHTPSTPSHLHIFTLSTSSHPRSLSPYPHTLHTLTSSTPSQLHTHLEQRPPEVEELQKRVRILQGKLEREKSRTGEEIARLASQKGAGGRRGELTPEITPQVDDKVLLLILCTIIVLSGCMKHVHVLCM